MAEKRAECVSARTLTGSAPAESRRKAAGIVPAQNVTEMKRRMKMLQNEAGDDSGVLGTLLGVYEDFVSAGHEFETFL